MIKYIFIVVIFINQIVVSQNFGAMRITNYADDRQSAFSFTFDDGLKTHFDNAAPILSQHGFIGSFYVLPPFLVEENQPTIWRYGRWNEFQSLAVMGHEIGSHTMNHDTLTTLVWGDVFTPGTLLYELFQSQNIIKQKINNELCISLNYPYTIHNAVVDSAAQLFYENGRTLGQIPNDSSLIRRRMV